MLHELLVTLSGHSSPRHSDHRDPHTFDNRENQLERFVSRSEEDLWRSLSRLGYLHENVETRCKIVSSSHKSILCRAVASFLIIGPLSRFSDHVVQLEERLLRENSDIVGAYNAVPLSGVVRALDGWQRKMQWLQRLVSMIGRGSDLSPDSTDATPSGIQIISFLRSETRTGFPVIETLAAETLQIAESTWMRQTASWLLYGSLPSSTQCDFFIKSHLVSTSGTNELEYEICYELIPAFLEKEVAQSILDIGNSIKRVKHGAINLSNANAINLEKAQTTVLSEHAELLMATKYPIQSFHLKQMVSKMCDNLSRKVLQKLLPPTEILHMLNVLRDFMLLERGDFSMAFIEAADDYVGNRYMTSATARDISRLGGMLIKEPELNLILTQAWSTMSASRDTEEDFEDEILETARKMIRYSIAKSYSPNEIKASHRSKSNSRSNSLFNDVLLMTPTLLSIHVTAPQDLFLISDDMNMYSSINAYLLSIRRTTMHISHLWQLRTLRKFQKPLSQANGPDSSLLSIETRTHEVNVRATWIVVSEIHFFFRQLGLYLQGEVVKGCTSAFHEWLQTRYRPVSKTDTNRPDTEHGTHPESLRKTWIRQNSFRQRSDSSLSGHLHRPDTGYPYLFEHLDLQVAITAHKKYLAHLYSALLLDDAIFTTNLRNLMARVEHLMALFLRLEAVNRTAQSSSLRPRTAQTSSNHIQEKSDIIGSMNSAKKSIALGMRDIVKRLAQIDEERSKHIAAPTPHQTQVKVVCSETNNGTVLSNFVPWRGINLGHLLMSLETLAKS